MKRIRISVFAAALSVLTYALWSLSSGHSHAASTCDGRTCITIGSYNIKLLGGNGSNDRNRDMDAIVERIARLDVVVLQEINTARGRAWDDDLWPQLKSKGFEIAAEGTFGGADPGRQQFILILAKTAQVQIVGDSADELIIPTTSPAFGTNCTYDSLRPPVTALLKAGKFDFRIVGVHLKSKSPVSGADEQCDDRIRRYQASKIYAEVARLRDNGGEQDVIVVGDFNSSFDEWEFSPLSGAGFKSLITGECKLPDQQECSHLVGPNPRFKPSLIDHIAIQDGTAEAVRGSGRIGKFTDLEKYLKTQSDHLPVWAQFHTDRDDD